MSYTGEETIPIHASAFPTLRSWQAWQTWQVWQAWQTTTTMSLRGAQQRSNPLERHDVIAEERSDEATPLTAGRLLRFARNDNGVLQDVVATEQQKKMNFSLVSVNSVPSVVRRSPLCIEVNAV